MIVNVYSTQRIDECQYVESEKKLPRAPDVRRELGKEEIYRMVMMRIVFVLPCFWPQPVVMMIWVPGL